MLKCTFLLLTLIILTLIFLLAKVHIKYLSIFIEITAMVSKIQEAIRGQKNAILIFGNKDKIFLNDDILIIND